MASPSLSTTTTVASSPAPAPTPLRPASHSTLFRPIPVDAPWQRLLHTTSPNPTAPLGSACTSTPSRSSTPSDHSIPLPATPRSPTPFVRFAPTPSPIPVTPHDPPAISDLQDDLSHLLSPPLPTRPFSPPRPRPRFFFSRVLHRITHPRDRARLRATAEAAAIAAARLSAQQAPADPALDAPSPLVNDDEHECWSDAELAMYAPAERDYASFSARSAQNYSASAAPNSFRRERLRPISTDLAWRGRGPRRRSLDERMGLAPRDFGSRYPGGGHRGIDDAGLRGTRSATAVRRGRYRLRGSRGSSGWLEVGDRRVGDRDERDGFGGRREGAAGWKRKWRSLSVERREKREDGGRCNSDPTVFKCGHSFQSEGSENAMSISSVTQTGSHTSSFN